ncbi:nitroreductase family protein [Desulforapulum autotrophicum HRM2]|uniref:Nitroreductase family protein n=1 Tax=Desulforapulum autotrophicum (strain ATCC 43914 / DSM 3382 / VKM B-1955 / HRM2) TaxID=177437 RepID=C0QAM3_DESAH|nr:nitroreductase family protein [Desulforapulum autotrophicum]ACN16806.1 nitroreductase family protein [Desulforapulum autotrophicum HRM2]
MKNRTVLELIKANRSCRRFDASYSLDEKMLRSLVDHARHSASAGNLQPLKYVLSCDKARNDAIFPCIVWAAYLTDWKGPVETEQPTGYIVILGDTTITKNFRCDHGIAAQSILLGARENGLAGCMIAAFDPKRLRKILAIDPRYEILLVLALGKPVEEAVIEDLAPEGDIRYFRDEHDVHHVPKRSLDELILS